jgi:hypothetical protein
VSNYLTCNEIDVHNLHALLRQKNSSSHCPHGMFNNLMLCVALFRAGDDQTLSHQSISPWLLMIGLQTAWQIAVAGTGVG